MKYFCLHHPPLVDRKKDLIDSFNTLNLDVEWVTGYLPEEITFPEDSRFKNKGEYSLYLKHQYCIKKQIDEKINYIVVFEDDAIIESNFNEHLQICINEFEQINGDILFLGICCGIQPSNITPDKRVYWEPGFMSRCTHCYLLPLKTAIIIHEQLLSKPAAYDFKLNEIILSHNLKSCYGEPGIHQGTQGGRYPSSLNN